MHTSGLHTLPRTSITRLKFSCSSLVSSKPFLGIGHFRRITWVSPTVLGSYKTLFQDVSLEHLHQYVAGLRLRLQSCYNKLWTRKRLYITCSNGAAVLRFACTAHLLHSAGSRIPACATGFSWPERAIHIASSFLDGFVDRTLQLSESEPKSSK